MKPSINFRRPAVAGGTLKSIAAAVLMGATLLAATSAQAGLVVTSALRAISADTTGSAAEFASVSTTSGPFSEVVQSVVSATGPSAVASQETVIQALSFIGNGTSVLNLFDGISGSAESVYSLLFTLTSSFAFDGSVILDATGNAFSHASFVLEHLGAGGGIVESGIDTLLSLSGTLGPGDYSLVARAESNSIDPNEAGRASFNIRLDFTELADPPAGVPEPHSLAIALAGLLACGVVRRRQPSPATATI